jgi:iron uptake system component EfeO
MSVRSVTAVGAASLLAFVVLLSGCSGRRPAAAAPVSGLPSAAKQRIIGEYRGYLVAQSDALVKAARAFAEVLVAGDVDRGRELYAPARVYYERIEPVAEALGVMDAKIDGREGDVPDAEWRGFHRIEKLLWKGGSDQDLDRFARLLVDDVTLLRARVETVPFTIDSLLTGAVELMNEVASTKLTGEEDRYSHTDLSDFAANVDGSLEIYLLVSGPVAARDPELARRIEAGFGKLQAELSVHRNGALYVSYETLASDQTRSLGSDVDALADSLSRIAGLLSDGQ